MSNEIDEKIDNVMMFAAQTFGNDFQYVVVMAVYDKEEKNAPSGTILNCGKTMREKLTLEIIGELCKK